MAALEGLLIFKAQSKSKIEIANHKSNCWFFTAEVAENAERLESTSRIWNNEFQIANPPPIVIPVTVMYIAVENEIL